MKGYPNLTPAAARVNAGLTQEEAARKIGTTKATIIKWEKGEVSPNMDKATVMAKVYGWPLQFIIFGKELTEA